MQNTTSASKIRFGPAGIPIQCKKRDSGSAVECCAKLGLYALELQFGMGIRLKKETAQKIKQEAEKYDVSLSCHAPYFINLCSNDFKKIEISKRNIIESARIIELAGGKIFVFHPGFYQNLSKKEAYDNAKKNLIEIKDAVEQHGIKNILFGAETVGKKTSFGGLDEILELSGELGFLWPVIDFAHIHARGDFELKTKEDYLKLFEKIERKIPEYPKRIHCHFSEINYSEKGEKNHLNLGTNNTPPYKKLMEALCKNGYSGTIICETPNLDIDAIKMQEYYKKVGGI
ncbi:MAG: TIM barrel protein [Candidatus Micrarchaeia archaeon]